MKPEEKKEEEIEQDTVEQDNLEKGEQEEEVVSEPDPLEQKEKEFAALNDKYLRLFSEFDNFRKRTAKEKLELSLSASGNVIKELLPILDDFERAVENNKNVDDIKVVRDGFELIQNKLLRSLTTKGLTPMDSKGEKFDVNIHEALTQIPAPKKSQKGKVVDVIEKGYLLNDKVLRFAKVVVGQ